MAEKTTTKARVEKRSLPTVGLFGSTRPYLKTSLDSTSIIYKHDECSPCRRKPTCDGDFRCMNAITVDDVMDTAKGVLKR